MSLSWREQQIVDEEGMMITPKKNLRTCPQGHQYYKSSDCPTCPICEQARKPETGFLSLLVAPARRALEREGITTLEQLARYREGDILKLHGIGPSTIPQLQNALQAKGLTFRKQGTMNTLLEGKVAVIHGAGGPIGGAVAHAFAREGAKVFLAGRTPAKLDKVADEIRWNGSLLGTAVVDALNERAVDEYVTAVVKQAGQLDISFNLIGYGDIHKPLLEISIEDFMQPIVNAMRSHFLAARAAARHMIQRGSGVILAFGGSGPQTLPGLGGFKIALDAIEGLRRQWACELGPHGIRVVTLKTGGVPESLSDTFAEKDEIAAEIQKATLLNRTATLADVGNVAAFVASDQARTMTSTVVNISCGALVD